MNPPIYRVFLNEIGWFRLNLLQRPIKKQKNVYSKNKHYRNLTKTRNFLITSQTINKSMMTLL